MEFANKKPSRNFILLARANQNFKQFNKMIKHTSVKTYRYLTTHRAKKIYSYLTIIGFNSLLLGKLELLINDPSCLITGISAKQFWQFTGYGFLEFMAATSMIILAVKAFGRFSKWFMPRYHDAREYIKNQN